MGKTFEQLDGVMAGALQLLALLYSLLVEIVSSFVVVILVLIVYIITRALVRSINFHLAQRGKRNEQARKSRER